MPSKNDKDTKESKNELTVSEAAEIAEVAAKAAAAKAESAKTAAEAAALKEYEEAVKAIAAVKATNASFTDKHNAERIFRREMGEPEFFLSKKELVPPRPVLTEDEQDEISRNVEIPKDNTPKYEPDFNLSPDGGTSSYEYGIHELTEESKNKLLNLKNNPNATEEEINRAEEDLKYLDSLYENYYFGMNVFRTAKGGRAKIHE